jgi:DNA-binding CsgD family transcriptional regulator
VLSGLALGHSTEELGVRLSMSPHTVRTHLRNIMRKLDARSRAHAVAIAIGDGAIDPP